MSVHFRFDWVDAGPSSDVLAQHTMAALSVAARGAVVTGALDRQSETYTRTVVVPLFSVAEWLVANWWHIWHEVGDVDKQPHPAFEARHNLAFAGDGFVLPSLRMTRATGRMRLEWARYSPEYARIEFVDEGQHDVEPEELETQFRNLIDAVLERLQGRPETRAAAETLGRAWAAVNDMDDEELEFSRAAALLGIDPFDAPDDVAAAVAAFWERTDPSVREDALAVASEDSLARVADWLNGAIERLAATPRGGAWPVLRERLQRPDGDEPWTLGYALARGARGWIGVGDGRFDFTNEGPLAIPREETQPPSPRIHGLVGAETPACMTAPHGRTGTRFLLARALGDYLGRQPGTRHGLLSSLETARQAQSRAFAAEFLVPAAALRRKINGGRADVEQIDDLGNEFGVSDWVIRHQIKNHELAEIVAY